MTRKDILDRLTLEIEALYADTDAIKFDEVEVINFALMADGALRIYVKVLFLGAWTILHGRINDIRDSISIKSYGIDLTDEEREFLEETTSQAPDRIAPPTKISRYVMHLVSQLRRVVGDGSELSCLTGALLGNSNLINLITHGNVDSVVAYVERVLSDLGCDNRSGAAVSWVTSLLSNPSLSSMIDHQIYSDQKIERG